MAPRRTRSFAPRIFDAESAEVATYPAAMCAEELLRNRRRVKVLALFM
jgi:hypothetical protein